MNKYEFEHPLQKRGRFVEANSFREADAIIRADNNGDSWNLTRAWDANGNKTWDVFMCLDELPPVCR